VAGFIGTNVSNDGFVSGPGVVSNLLDNIGTVEPGTVTQPATLTASTLSIEANSTLTFNLNEPNTVGSGVNDLIKVKGNVNINGGATININPVGILQDGVAYTIISFSGTIANGNVSELGVAPVDGYNFTVNSTANSITVTPSGGPPVWNGGSTTDSDWSDPANWGSVTIVANDLLYFAGNARLNNTNDTAAGTAYDTIEFVTGSGAFVLNGNPIVLSGNINDLASNPETVDVGLNFGTIQTLNGAGGTLIIGGGVTNTASSLNALILQGTGILTNILNSTSTTGTNYLAVQGASSLWTLVDNPTHTSISVPWPLEITNGTLVIGNSGSAPNFTTTSLQGAPQDNQIGYTVGSTATFIVSNGTFATSARLNTCAAAGAITGIVDVVNGTLNVASQFQNVNGGVGNVGVINISGGTMTTPGTFFVASRGIGTLNLTGGALDCITLDVSRNASSDSSVGVVNLNGGTIACANVGTLTSANGGTGTPTATFNFNGGVLEATNNSATFYQGSIAAPVCHITSLVQAGGAIINNDGFAITFLEPLQSGTAHDGGLTIQGTGTVTLNDTNTYNGPTVISAGTLALAAPGGNGLTGGGNIIIAGGAAFNVGPLSAGFTLASGQVLSNSTSTASIGGNLNTGSGKLSLTYASGTPSLTVTNGTVTLSATTGLTINNTGAALPVGTYTIISAGTGGAVAGTAPSSVTVTGGGTAAGQPLTLQISGGSLVLVVGSPAKQAVITGISVSGNTLTITATNGASGGQYVVLESTNLLVPVSQWTPVFTNNFNGSGNLNVSTNVVSASNVQVFYILQMP
jgi:autotransporter-associated beta strand protein